MGARRGREGDLLRTLIRPNGWCKVARSSETRPKTVDEGGKEEGNLKGPHFWMRGQEDDGSTEASIGGTGSRGGGSF